MLPDHWLLVQQFSACAMAGVILIVQFVVYPAFRGVSPSVWAEYHSRHTRSISFVVVPLMLAELASGALLWVRAPSDQAWQALLLAVVWISTFGIQVPLHRRLASAWDRATVDRLIRTNWIRTAAWTLKAVLAIVDPSVQ